MTWPAASADALPSLVWWPVTWSYKASELFLPAPTLLPTPKDRIDVIPVHSGLFKKTYLVLFLCVCFAFMYIWVPRACRYWKRLEEGVRNPGIGVIARYEQLCGCGDLNPDLPEGHQVCFSLKLSYSSSSSPGRVFWMILFFNTAHIFTLQLSHLKLPG